MNSKLGYSLFSTFTMVLEHQTNDTFTNRVTTPLHQNTPSFLIQFQLNQEGKMESMTIAFSEGGERFEKVE